VVPKTSADDRTTIPGDSETGVELRAFFDTRPFAAMFER